MYLPWLLSLVIAFAIKKIILGKDKDLQIGNIRFAFLGGKLALHNVQYVSKNVLVRVQRLVLTFRWWAPIYRNEEQWVTEREEGSSKMNNQYDHRNINYMDASMHHSSNNRKGKYKYDKTNINVATEDSNTADDLNKKNMFKNNNNNNNRGNTTTNNNSSSSSSNNNNNNNNKKTTNNEGAESRYDLPYRITLDLLGLEMMAFNNSDVYDELEKIKKQAEKELSKGSKKSFDEVNNKRRNNSFDGNNNTDDYEYNEYSEDLNNRGKSLEEDDDEKNADINADLFLKALDLPWFYKASPTMKIRVKCGNFYAGNQRTPTILIAVVQSGVIRHTAKLLSNIRTAKNRNLDRYRVYTRADVHNVHVVAIGNDDFISTR